MNEASGQFTVAKHMAETIVRSLEDGAVAVLATLIEALPDAGAKLFINSSAELTMGSTNDGALDEWIARQAGVFLNSRAEAQTFKVEEFAPQLTDWRGTRILFERIENEPRLVICGAGHVGASLARLAHSIGYRVTLIDDRADFVTRARFPETEIELVAASESWEQAVRTSIGKGRGVSVAVVTRGHNEDEECLRAVIAAKPDYVGMIGSKRRTNIVLERLRETGIEEEILREVRAPVGLDIGAVSPEEVALAILAEIIAERRGGSGKPLSMWRRT
jgi:xanthine dehydrogenase accessory factor